MYKWKSKRDQKFPLLIGFVILIVVLALVFSQSAGFPFSIKFSPEFSTAGFVEVEPDARVLGEFGVVSLTGGCYSLTANTEAEQAESIFNGLNKIVGVRPGTHDLMKDAFENLEIKVVMVKIVELRNDTFIGRLILQSGNRVADLDSRPSDGISIAVRTDAPIYVKEDLMKEQGTYIC